VNLSFAKPSVEFRCLVEEQRAEVSQTLTAIRASRKTSALIVPAYDKCTTLNSLPSRQTDPSSRDPTGAPVTAKRSDRSAWLLSGGTSGWSNITTVRFCLVVIAVTLVSGSTNPLLDALVQP